MKQIKIFINLARLNKPIGFMLLFWPCAWGLSLAYQAEIKLEEYIYFLFLFFCGSVLMRSAGCIFNDIIDKDIDKKVQRTKNRPLALGVISVKRSLMYVATICLIAFGILIQFNQITIVLGMASMFLAFTYPFMKRITYWPQLFLGLTFNWGIIMGWSSLSPQISIEILLLYISAIFWTLGYDTIYGLQDVNDDEIIGMKSTSIKFKKNPKIFVGMCYSLTSILLIFMMNHSFGLNFSTFFLLIFLLSLTFQIIILDVRKPKSCLNVFKSNNYSGLFLFLSIILYTIK